MNDRQNFRSNILADFSKETWISKKSDYYNHISYLAKESGKTKTSILHQRQQIQ